MLLLRRDTGSAHVRLKRLRNMLDRCWKMCFDSNPLTVFLLRALRDKCWAYSLFRVVLPVTNSVKLLDGYHLGPKLKDFFWDPISEDVSMKGGGFRKKRFL